MTKKEYTRFIRTIPEKFQKILKDNNKTFKDFAGEDDIIDTKEISSTIKFLMNKLDETEKREAGSK